MVVQRLRVVIVDELEDPSDRKRAVVVGRVGLEDQLMTTRGDLVSDVMLSGLAHNG